VEHFDQFRRRFRLAGGHVFRRAPQTKCDAFMEYVVLPRLVLDSYVHFDGVAVRGTSTLCATLRGVLHVNSPCFVAQALSFKNINGEFASNSFQNVINRPVSTDPWNLVSGT
jgi:hypothetical protein